MIMRGISDVPSKIVKLVEVRAASAVQTILTDIDTLKKYRHLAIEGAPPQRTGLRTSH